MIRERSPNYPQLSLEEAVGRVQTLFKRNSRSPVAPEAAVKAWGYTSLNGAARRHLSAVRQYGLISYEKNGDVRISQRGLIIAMRSPGAPEFGEALRDAALSPDVFRDLYNSKRGASEEALQHYLVADRKFSPDGAKQVIGAYQATLEFAKLSEPSYNEDAEEESSVDHIEHRETAQGRRLASDQNSDRPAVESYRWPLSAGVTAEVTFRGNKVTRRELQLLRRYLALAETALDGENPQLDHDTPVPAGSDDEMGN
jgi:hypothetical protein